MYLEELASWRMLTEDELDLVFQEAVLLIKGNHTDDRCTHFQNKLLSESKTVLVTYEIDSTKLHIDYSSFHTVPSHDEDPVMNADIMVHFLIEKGLKIVIDMTSLSTESLFIILKAFYDISFDDLTIVYVQPIEYRRAETGAIVPNFLLSEEHSTVSPIPGFLRLPDPEKPSSLLVFLGFEGGRFKELCEHLFTDGKIEITPIMPIPSFAAGWHMIGLYLNLDTLKTTDIIADLKRVTAWDPFYALSVLEKQYSRKSNSHQLIIAPLGTKPHTLASVIFAIRHDDVTILYDHPRVFRQRSIGIGQVWGYSLKDIFD